MRQILQKAFEALPRGEQTRIAEAMGERTSTVNKWAKGYNAPGPDVDLRKLEKLLHLDDGALGYAAGVTPPPRNDDTAKLRAEIRRQGASIERLEALVRLIAEQSGIQLDPEPPSSRRAPTKGRQSKVHP